MEAKQAGCRKLLSALVIVTVCLIWGNSLLPASVSGSISDWIKNLLNSVFSGLFGVDGMSGDHLLRKIAHATEFAALGAELMLLIDRRLSSKLLLLGVGTALFDETIQLFIKGRSGMIRDVWIDLGGFVFGALSVLVITRLHRRRSRPTEK